MLPILPLLTGAALAGYLVFDEKRQATKRCAGHAVEKGRWGNRSHRLRPVTTLPSNGTPRTPGREKTPLPAETGGDHPLIAGTATDGGRTHVNRHLLASGSATALMLAGTFVNPSFALAGLGPLLYAFTPFFRDAWSAAKQRRLNIVVLDAIVFSGLMATGLWIEAAALTFGINLAARLLSAAEDRSHRKLLDIFDRRPPSVWVLKDGVEIEIPFEDLVAGDLVVVRAGEVIPADGVVSDGAGTVDQRILTGEARSVEKLAGDAALAGTLVLTGRLQILVERSGRDTAAARIAQVLNQTTDFRQKLQWRWLKVLDRTAPISLGIGATTLVFLGPTSAIAMIFASAIGYPMRTAAPISLLSHLRLSSRRMILVKDGRILEQLGRIDTVVFDKTGTLTEDRPFVAAVHALAPWTDNDVLRRAAAAEWRQSHPIAEAIHACADEWGLDVPIPDDAHAEIGLGLKVHLGPELIHVGSARFMTAEEIDLSDATLALSADSGETGYALVWVAVDRKVVGAIDLRPRIRPEAETVVAALKARGLRVCIISGDHVAPTRDLAETLGIPEFHAEVMPDGKASLVRSFQEAGRRVCFVGDGINDSIALKQADVSVSLTGAASMAMDTAHVLLLDQSLDRLPALFELADAFARNMRQSFALSTTPTVVGMGGVLFLHLGLLPMAALYYVGLSMGVANAFAPLLFEKRNQINDAP